MKKRIILLTLVTILILSFCSISIFAEANNASNEPVEFFDFSLEDCIFEPNETSKFYSWKSESMLLRPTGSNEDKMVFSYNEEYKALQIDFNDVMTTNGSCLWFSLSEAHEVSADKSYYLVFRYKYNGNATSGFLSPNQMLSGYSSVNNWSASNSGGRVLKSLNAAGMPTITDGDWLLSFVRISWQDKMTSIEYDAEKTNIKVIRTSLVDTMSNDSVILKSVGLFEDIAGLSSMQAIDEDAVKNLRTTASVHFSMKKSFETSDKVAYQVDEENVKSVKYYEKADSEWKALDSAPASDGTYMIEVVLNDGYYFESSWLGASEDVDKGILKFEFTVGEVQKETEAPSKTSDVPNKTEKPDNGTKDNTDDDGNKNGLVIGIIVAAVVVVAIVVFVIIRKKQGK